MKKIIIFSIIFLSSLFASAQELQGAYFLKGYNYTYKLNPAFQGRTFFSVGVGNVNFRVGSNFGTDNFVFEKNGKKLSFLHPDVTLEEFMAKVKDKSQTRLSADITLLSLGFKTKGNFYNTFDIGLRSSFTNSIPRDFFKLLKSSGEGLYDMSSWNVNGLSYLEYSYGLSYNLSDKFYFGARFKFLRGVARFSNTLNVKLEMSTEQWSISSFDNSIEVSLWTDLKGDIGNVDDYVDFKKFNAVQLSPLYKPRSYGFAFDVGLAYKPLKFLTLSASLTDFGSIRWHNSIVALSQEGSFTFNGIQELLQNTQSISPGTEEEKANQIREKVDQMLSAFKFKYQESTSKFRAIPSTIRLGAEASLPSYDKLSFGVLGSFRLYSASFNEIRFCAQFTPFKLLGLSASLAYNDSGVECGAAGLLNLGPFSFFVGLDAIPTSIKFTNTNSVYLPVQSQNLQVSVGINIVL